MPATKKASAKAAAPKGNKKASPQPNPAVKKAAPQKAAPAASTKSKSAGPAAAPKSAASADSLITSFKDFKPYPIKKDEEYMNERQVAHFRDILHAWKRDLMEEVDRTMHYMQDEAANFPDPNDRASQESDFTLELRARDRERKLIKKIDEALARLEANEYGECESCGVEIGIRRLEARPTATLCIDCKTLDEIREKQLGD